MTGNPRSIRTPIEDKNNVQNFGQDRDYWYMSFESEGNVKFEVKPMFPPPLETKDDMMNKAKLAYELRMANQPTYKTMN